MSDNKYKPGDEVWIAQQVETRMRPLKIPLFAVQVTDFGVKQQTVYFGPNGQPVDGDVFPTIEACEKAINIIETHKNSFNKAMGELMKEVNGSSGLVDASGKKMV